MTMSNLAVVVPTVPTPGYNRSVDMIEEATQYKTELLEKLFGVRAQTVSGAVITNPLNALPYGSNIVGVGYGTKTTVGATVEGQIAVRVYVRTKMTLASVPIDQQIPADINGTPTDVVTVGDITAYAHAWPVGCGVSVGHKSITAGTLGCLVQKNGDSAKYILSNNHVLANANTATIGDEILQPGPLDGGVLMGTPNDIIAHLTDFESLILATPGSPPSPTPNLYDAAIAVVDITGNVAPDILKIGRATAPVMTASLYQSVRKYGRTTLHTVGVITDISASIRVGYGTQVADFDDQIAIIGAGGPFSGGGDSGSLIVDAVSLRPVGLLFAGGASTTFANPIDVVLTRFGAQIL